MEQRTNVYCSITTQFNYYKSFAIKRHQRIRIKVQNFTDFIEPLFKVLFILLRIALWKPFLNFKTLWKALHILFVLLFRNCNRWFKNLKPFSFGIQKYLYLFTAFKLTLLPAKKLTFSINDKWHITSHFTFL